MSTRSIVTSIVVAAVAAAGGYLIGRARSPRSDSSIAPVEAPQIYVCSMHPTFQLDRPGKCAICDMPLVPASAAGIDSTGPLMLQLSDHALAMASVETTPVSRQVLSRDLRAVGKIQYNESSLATVTARVDGYAERLFVNFTGVDIKAGDHLVEVYSPDLIVAQQELLIALQSSAGEQAGSLVETAKLKLRRWGLTEDQIQVLAESKTIADRVTLYSPIQGTVIEKPILENSAFEAGDVLYRVANLDTVWVNLDIYEFDLAWVRYGQRVDLFAEAIPGRAFEGRVTFVQPIVDEETRTVRVPVHVENVDHALKPGMFVSAAIRSTLGADGRAAATGVEGKYSCPMHPQVLREEPGDCPICEMHLEQIPGHEPATVAPIPPSESGPAAPEYACPMKCEAATTYAAPGNCPVCAMKLESVAAEASSTEPGLLAVPTSAVLDSGTRRIVYVEVSRGLFEPREVVLGPRAGGFFPVLNGLAEGERVVTRGGFLIDSQFQITGHPSLFYPGGLMPGSASHSHGGSAADDSQAPTNPAAGDAADPHQHRGRDSR